MWQKLVATVKTLLQDLMQHVLNTGAEFPLINESLSLCPSFTATIPMFVEKSVLEKSRGAVYKASHFPRIVCLQSVI